jgi:serine phosphatase RsbU (regulator of sigma subunit)
MQQPNDLPALRFADEDGPHTIVLDRESMTIGRLPDQDIVLRDSFVSRRHAAIHRVDGGYEVVDIDSVHGTWVNGKRIERALLRHGDVLQFGSPTAVRVLLQFGDAPVTPSHSPITGDLLSAFNVLGRETGEVKPAARAMEQLSFLLIAVRRLNAGGAKGEILQALLQLTIQLTNVERGFVFLRQRGTMSLALGLRADGSALDEDQTVSRRAMERAIESAEKFSVSDTLADSEAGAWSSVAANFIRRIYCIPLRKHISAGDPGQLLGLLYLDSQLDAGKLSEIDDALLDTVASEAATLLDNILLAEAEMRANRAAEELAVAARIHAGLMSIALPDPHYAALQARSIPCLAIGGDFYDAVELEDCLGGIIADVSGKGVPASIVAATLQGIIHAQMLTGQPLEEIAGLVNRFLCTRNVGRYATMVLLKLYPDGRVEYVNCGHIQPFVVTAAGVRRLEVANLIVGLIPGALYRCAEFRLDPGDRILLATDGVTEAENAGEEFFGESRFESAAQVERLDGILGQVTAFQAQHPAQDDCTLLEIEYRCPSAASSQAALEP